MNFLALCQRAATECGVASNGAIQTLLPTVVGATGSLGRVVNWVGDAWLELQMEHDDWSWMRASNILGSGISFTTVAGQYSYPLGLSNSGTSDFSGDFAGDFTNNGFSDFGGDFVGDFSDYGGEVGVAPNLFGKWDRDTFRCNTTAIGFLDETFLEDIPFDTWRNAYMYGAMRRVQTRPVVIAVGPDQSLNLGPPPNGNYTITGDYFVAPTAMITDTDIPTGLPTRFHMLIVYFAMIKYADYESAPEVSNRGIRESARMYAQLQAVRAPRFHFSGALA